MKTSVRFLAVLVAVLMIATAAISVAAFSDVEEGYEHATAIATLSQLGVIGGYEDGTFQPNKNVERDEMAKLVYVLYTTFQTAGKGTAKFSDLAADNWAAGYVTWCSAKSIVGGYEDGTFRPDNNVTYDEALKMVCATLGYTDFDSALWPTDVRQKALKDLDLGEDIEAEGSDKLTRGQVAQLLYNALFEDMNETYVATEVKKYAQTDKDGNVTGYIAIESPVEKHKTLAADVWEFTENVVRVIGTENLGYNGATKSGKEDMIRLEGVNELVKLEDLGLEAYEKNTDALIGLDIMTVEKEGETVAKATVLGSVKLADVASAGTEDTGLVITDEVKIDGVKYADVKNSDTLFSALKTLVYGDGTVVATDPFAIATENAGKTSELEYPHIALVMDNDGDGVVDSIAIKYYTLGEVTAVKNVKATTKTEAYTEYTLEGGAKLTSDKIADGKTLAKGDVFVYATLNGTTYVDTVIEPVTAGVSRITDKEIYLEGVEAPVKYVDGGNFLKDVAEVVINGEALFDKDAKDQDYYIYNGFVVKTSMTAAGAADAYDLAILLYVEDATKPVVDGHKVSVTYPAVLMINGKSETVNLNASDALDGATAQAVIDSGDYALSDKTGDGYVDYANLLVNYVVNEDGTYTLSTTATDISADAEKPGETIGDTVIVAADSEITVNAKTGLYKVGDYTFELDENSVLYYTIPMDEDDEKNNSKTLANYTAANIVKDFDKAETAQLTYLRRIDDSTFVLVATVLDGEIEVDITESEKTYKNDANKIFYATKTADTVGIDGNGYYEHTFMDWATFADSAASVNTATAIADATKTVAGKFYGWDEKKEIYVEVTEDNSDAVQLGTIASIDTDRGLIYIDGVKFIEDNKEVDFADGIKLGDAKILATAKVNDYKTMVTDLDLAKIAEIAENAEKTLDVAVGVSYDEEGELQIAWIIVDNYIYSESEEAYVITTDILESLRGAE